MRESGRVRDVGGQGGDHADPRYAHRRLRRRERLRALRRAIGYIAFGTGMVVAVAGVVIWAVERDGFPTIGLGMWWALQTVTTVGYGDVVPRTDVGRVVASVIMLTGVAFVAILTATVVSQQARRTAEGGRSRPARARDRSATGGGAARADRGTARIVSAPRDATRVR